VSDGGFWRGKRVLVTGHSGFKGGWLCLWLKELGARVTGYALPPPTNPSLFELARIADCVQSITGNILDRSSLDGAFAASEPEIVFHLAAQPIVRLSYADPFDTYMTNVMGTVSVLESVRTCRSVRAVVVVTSDKCYENPEWHWGCRETDPMGGHDPYSSSKGCAELVASAYRRSYFTTEAGSGVALASARAGNVIGGGDWARDRLIPDVVRAAIAGGSASIRNPSAVRPWQHVLESVSGYLALAECLCSSERVFQDAWNFGPRDEDAVSVSAVLRMFCAHLGARARWHAEREGDAPHEAHFLHLDITKARAVLGWEPRWRLDRGLRATADWYASYMAGDDMREVSLIQIAEFAAYDPQAAPSAASGRT
jgi:CDP-glucose 4,6-dehydratase